MKAKNNTALSVFIIVYFYVLKVFGKKVYVENENLVGAENQLDDNLYVLRTTLEKGVGQKVFCYESLTNFDPSKLWSPVTVKISASDDHWLKVRHAASDNLHTIVDNKIQKILGISDSDDIKDLLSNRKSFVFFPPPSILTDCPSIIWSSNLSECTLHLSPFGKSCVSVSVRTPSGRKDPVIFLTTHFAFNINLLFRFIVGMLILVLSHEMSKSKVFQYSAGAIAGCFAGLLLLLLYTLKKKRGVFSSPFLLGSLYFCSMYLGVKNVSARLISSYWEYLLCYFVIAVFIGVLLVRWLRSDPAVKHRVRVLVKWFLRFVGFCFLFQSTFSWYVEILWFFVLLMLYIHHKLGKSKSKEE